MYMLLKAELTHMCVWDRQLQIQRYFVIILTFKKMALSNILPFLGEKNDQIVTEYFSDPSIVVLHS